MESLLGCMTDQGLIMSRLKWVFLYFVSKQFSVNKIRYKKIIA